MAPARKLLCTVDDIVAHGDRVYSVTLRPERQAPRFKAGQFLHLALDPYDPSGFWPESRAFSIASPPAERERLRITYSAQGAFTQRMERTLEVGSEVWVKMPYGEFIIEPRGEVVLLAGGTGITAFTAFLQQLNGTEPCSVLLAYGARHDGLLIYRDIVEACAARVPQLSTLYFLEQTTDTMAVTGRVSVEPVWARLRQPLDAAYFVAGPPLMLKSLKAGLLARNVRPDAIHIDAWE